MKKLFLGTLFLGVGIYITCSNDGQGKCKRWYFPAAHRISRTTGTGCDTGDECLCCP